MVPVQLLPLVPEGEAVSLQPVPVDLAYEVGGAALVAAAADGVLAAGGHQVTLQTCEGGCKVCHLHVHILHSSSLVDPDAGQPQRVEPVPVLLGDVLLEEEHQLQLGLGPHVLQARHLEGLEIARVRGLGEPQLTELLQCQIFETFLSSQNLEMENYLHEKMIFN